VRILIFHGYLLSGTGSNVYNARLVEALVRDGHEVHLLSQERHPEQHAFLAAAGDWEEGSLRVRELPGRELAAPGRATLYRPAIGELLPVYVADRYEGLQACTFAQCSDAEIERYVEANVAAVAEVLERSRAELALANHLVMGPLILARGLAEAIPYAVKIHGSALEYTVKPERERFLAAALEGLAPARGVLVGSRHTAESLWAALEQPGLREKTRLGPPGVDVSRFAPREAEPAAVGLRELAGELRRDAPRRATGSAAQQASVFERDSNDAAAAIEALDSRRERLVAYVGKLIVSKGVDLMAAAWPLVLEGEPDAKLVVVGFGAYRDGLSSLLAALAAGDLESARGLARAGRALEDPSVAARPLRHLLAFLEALQGDRRERYLESARRLPESVVLTGRLEHEELAELLPACEALIAPSTFPEAFGMVAAEAAACGALPIVARHSGLGEVSDVLATTLPAQATPWLSFAVDDSAVQSIAACVLGWLSADAALRAQAREALVRTVRRRWSWEGVCTAVIAAARGELDTLAAP
jgi:glycosyltransferase involved in cell wall biosynthesis